MRQFWTVVVAFGVVLSIVSSLVVIVAYFQSEASQRFVLSLITGLSVLLVGLVSLLWATVRTLQNAPRVMASYVLKKPNSDRFKGIKFSDILSSKDVIVVVGAKEPHPHFGFAAVDSDWDWATKLCTKYGFGAPRSDTEVNETELSQRSLIVVGGLFVNMLAYEVNDQMPLAQVNISRENLVDRAIFSLLSNRYYSGRAFGAIQAAPNPRNEHKGMILAFGLHREGTAAAVRALIELVGDLDKGNAKDASFPARIVRAKISNGIVNIEGFEE